ncbi:MAG: tellurite resistance/C4-dicarboxylate transporter family protein [Flavisolibacter sp.]
MQNNLLQKVPPSSLAFVMATGIVGMAANLLHQLNMSKLMFWITNISFFILLLMVVLRLLFYFKRFVSDLASHDKGAGVLTLVAGSSILGINYAQGQNNYKMAEIFLFFSLITWVILIYAFLLSVILKKEKPPLRTGMNGSWLLLTVATQSIAVLSTTISSVYFHDAMIFIALTSFLLGIALYLLIITMDFYRLLFHPVESEDVKPSYWINLGAAAITSVAGFVLAKTVGGDALFGDYYSFIKSAAVMFWAIASFWLPLLLLMELWRYVIKKSSLQYSPDWWSMVFPLGMYTVATFRLSEQITFSFLTTIANIFLFIALLAWLGTFIGMCVHFLTQNQNKEQPLPVNN